MADNEVVDKENSVFSIEASLQYEKNLQTALDYTLLLLLIA